MAVSRLMATMDVGAVERAMLGLKDEAARQTAPLDLRSCVWILIECIAVFPHKLPINVLRDEVQSP